jgi:UDP-N-acetylglucosamine--N-acetylmuramyl-(pentapeptide) pyrophosphoryl-undecaprenol N-acetylglucosamine transferase
MRIIVTGGGTGGHTSPAVAVIQELQQRDPQLAVQWVGRRGNVEERVCASLAIPFRGLPVEGWPRRRRWRKPWVAAKLAWSMARAWVLLRRFRPDVVLGVGGYVSLPVVYMAGRMGIPTFLHEQNRLLGMANRIGAARATRLFLSYPNTKGHYPQDRAAVVGNPVRLAFRTPPARDEARRAFDLGPELDATPAVLVVGGSQGAHRLNEAVAGLLPKLHQDEAAVIWMTGRADAALGRDAAASATVAVRTFPFIDDMPAACAAADLIVSRAGASSTAEIAVMARPSILVPYPHATDNHQEQNARAFEEHGAATVLLDADCAPETLLAAMRALLGDPDRLDAMAKAAAGLAQPQAAERIVDALLQYAFEEQPTA